MLFLAGGQEQLNSTTQQAGIEAKSFRFQRARAQMGDITGTLLITTTLNKLNYSLGRIGFDYLYSRREVQVLRQGELPLCQQLSKP